MLQFLQKCSVTMRKEKKRIRFLAIIEEQLEVQTMYVCSRVRQTQKAAPR